MTAGGVHRLSVEEFQERYTPAEYDPEGVGWGAVRQHPNFFTVNPMNPDRIHGGTWDAFVADIRQDGVREPVVVERVSGEVVEGHHRVVAAEEAGRDVPFVFEETT